jgi:hypothetical protein
VKDLKGLILNGVGTMDVTQVNTKKLTVTLGGTGKLTVAGRADVLQLTLIGNGDSLGEGLKTTRATVQQRSIGNASKQLDVTIGGIGTVEYIGAPQIRRTILGLGTVKKKR